MTLRAQFTWHKHAMMVVCAFLFTSTIHAQRKWVTINNPNYDSKRNLSFGMSLGLHTSAFRVKYSQGYTSAAFDTLYAVEPLWSNGFSLGGLMNYKLADFFDLRIEPQFSFYDHELQYKFTDNTPTENVVVENVMIEIPLLMKYKSERRGNVRMYMVGGLKPSIEASGKKDLKKISTTLETKDWNFNADFGFRFDFYYPLFKFSPEIRFSKGLVNVLDNKTNRYGQPLDCLHTNTVNIYFIFQ
jgi:hypothetical protein